MILDFMNTMHSVENWHVLSLSSQMGNIGSEISRAKNWRGRNDIQYIKALERAFELLDLTLSDPARNHQLREISRVREVLADIYLGSFEYKTTLEDLDRYFMPFAIVARKEMNR
ncbi:MAG: Uncharacterized protein G01um101418_204 [Parcubacteria group bacterium Gr01-1014_18]|nr:MAG: Uncharacterized protein Greene041636_172 [Parcubacteria group bacterium Greene0416_36]TSC81364.1 MAG: Uncharacterized protein G01um101418_204 [Parcubacteria group bacterium Gr01-1014_18]TSC99450.1 MAG: Uncharacterized protein Greene101420_117 [Parcubacteria group bacterium Greene1014_20]TSD07631.1 MAG: Uncharacterized protein Greene07142_88 [Parcubacteria group bacterium Greene0714_2]